ncbi:g7888 [Coccomyxa elongata]
MQSRRRRKSSWTGTGGEASASCDCSCRWLVVGGFVLIALSAWVAFMAYKERRRWLLTWSSVYFATSVFMTLLTYIKGPDPHDMFGCSVPFSLWVGSLFVATLSYYTSDYMRQGQDAPEKRNERYVYDPTAGEYVLATQLSEYHVV